MFKLSDIEGVVVEKKRIKESSAVYMPFEDTGFNKAIDAQSQVRLQLKREKLILAVIKGYDRYYAMPQPERAMNVYDYIADALISAIDKNPSEYIEVVR